MDITEFLISLDEDQKKYLRRLCVNVYMDRDNSKEMEQILVSLKLDPQEMNELMRAGSPYLITLFMKRNGILTT